MRFCERRLGNRYRTVPVVHAYASNTSPQPLCPLLRVPPFPPQLMVFGDRGVPATFRHMNGYGNHSFRVVNSAGRAHYVKFHVKTDVSGSCRYR